VQYPRDSLLISPAVSLVHSLPLFQLLYHQLSLPISLQLVPVLRQLASLL
jgi:hypothetical protein